MKRLIEKIKLMFACQPRLRQTCVSGSDYRYPMTYDQPCQIDCRVTSCKFYKGAGKCENVSPAITLNENGKFVCWSKADR
jgi:hypothetical protein